MNNSDIFVAHRGLHLQSDKIPENSLKAFEMAIIEGYEIELDVRLTSDKVPVVFHDLSLKRMTGNSKNINCMTLKQIKELNLNDTKHKIPTLKEALELINGSCIVFIDLKGYNLFGKELEKQVISCLSNYKGKVVLMAFNPLRLKYMYKRLKCKDLCQLIVNTDDKITDCIINKLVTNRFIIKKITHADILGYNKKRTDKSNYIKGREKNCKLLSWTIKSQKECDRIKSYCDYIVFEDFIPDSNT